ncbi:hypothetical protein [Colwellia demingiae]|uniref:hypothetical protein n=1 Tax=Colwellia demingiae TaxID=89401 RepID=UPI0014787D0C|nr:hypothetical protein [Colwellia demingiae]
MGLIEAILISLGLLPAKELGKSMKQSKTLTIMVIIGLVFVGGFGLFLFNMAGIQ